MSIILKTNKKPIKNFTIFAERHCGTNFLERWMVKSFEIPVTWKYGWKHFFTHNKSILKNQNTLFIGVVRNPYNWIPAMFKTPYHIMNISENTTLFEFMNMPIISCGPKNEPLEKEYKNIFYLRKTKNQYLLNTMNEICNNYLLINYENLANIDTIFNELIFNFTFSSYRFFPNEHPQHNYNLSNLEIETINKKLEWQTENILGYHLN